MTALHWLSATAILTALFWVPYILERMASLGVMGTLRPVDPEDIEIDWRGATHSSLPRTVAQGLATPAPLPPTIHQRADPPVGTRFTERSAGAAGRANSGSPSPPRRDARHAH